MLEMYCSKQSDIDMESMICTNHEKALLKYSKKMLREETKIGERYLFFTPSKFDIENDTCPSAPMQLFNDQLTPQDIMNFEAKYHELQLPSKSIYV